MKPFNLERALAGDPVRCRDEGIKVLRLIHMPEMKREDNLLIIYADEHNEYVSWLYPDGVFRRNMEKPIDLFMATKKVTRWINIFKQENDDLTSSNILWKNELIAEEFGRKSINYHSTVPVEIEI